MLTFFPIPSCPYGRLTTARYLNRSAKLITSQKIFITVENNLSLLGFTNIRKSFGLVHQSDGQGGDLSRSWNRFYVETMFNRGDFTWSIKPRWRIPESGKGSPADIGGDDNPNIERYMGHFE